MKGFLDAYVEAVEKISGVRIAPLSSKTLAAKPS